MSAQSHSVVLMVPPICFSGPVPIPSLSFLFWPCSVFSDTFTDTHTITLTVTDAAAAPHANLSSAEATVTHTCVHTCSSYVLGGM